MCGPRAGLVLAILVGAPAGSAGAGSIQGETLRIYWDYTGSTEPLYPVTFTVGLGAELQSWYGAPPGHFVVDVDDELITISNHAPLDPGPADFNGIVFEDVTGTLPDFTAAYSTLVTGDYLGIEVFHDPDHIYIDLASVGHVDPGQWFMVAFDMASTAPDPLPDLPPEPVQDHVTSGSTGWDAEYDLGVEDEVIMIDLDILLFGADPGDALRQQWEEGIEGIWSDAFDVTDGTHLYPIRVNVEWVTEDPDLTVYVTDGVGRPTMRHWFTELLPMYGNQYQDEVAAHEIGHKMGLYDEYPGGTLDPDTGFTTTNSIMADLGPPRWWHFQTIVDWLAGRVDRDLSLAMSPLPPYPLDPPIPEFFDLHPSTPIPEPATVALLIFGLGGLAVGAGIRRRRRDASSAGRTG